MKNNKFLYSTNEFFDENNISKTLLIDKNSLVYTIEGSPCTPFFILMNSAAIDNHLALIECNSNLNKNFFYYILVKNKKNFSKFIIGSTLTAIPIKQFKETIIHFPSLREQTKIATFFSLLDKQIELWEKKLQLVELVEKKMMSVLFTYNNFLPKLRFRGFNGKWEEKKIKDVSFVNCGKTPPTQKKHLWNGNIPFVTPTDIHGKYQFKTERYTTNLGIQYSKISQINSIFVTCVASIGKNSICKIPSAFNQQINNVYVKKEYDYEFIYYLICANANFIRSQSSKSATEIINKNNFENLSLYMSPSLQEQTKISNFLSRIDVQIEKYNSYIKILKETQKYYLNKLFYC